VRATGRFDEVGVAFWKEEPALSRAFDAIESDDLTVVPVFISEGYFTREVLPREMGLTGRVTCVEGRRVAYTAPVGSHRALARVIAARAAEAGADEASSVVVLGHGTPQNPHSEENVYAQAARVRETGRFGEVVTLFMDQEPRIGGVFEATRAETVVVVPLFVAEGWHVGQTIPEGLALEGPELRQGGRVLRYTAPVGTHPLVAEVVLELADEAARW
jgi:sirohydrochlorin cobaltochelatase